MAHPAFRTRELQFAAKVEGTSGTEDAPAADTNALLVRDTTNFRPNFQTIQTNFANASLSVTKPIPAGGYCSAELQTYLKGSGTAGTAPCYGTLLRASGMGLTTTGSPVADTAQAGAASTITLHSGASATNNAYRGMVIRTTGGTGSGQVRVIKGYVGATKVATVYPAWTVQPDNTTEFSIDANNLYRPISSSLETISARLWRHNRTSGQNSKRWDMIAAMADFTATLTPGAAAELNFTLRGIKPRNPSDVSRPSAPTLQTDFVPPLLSALIYLGGVPVRFSQLQFALGATVEQFPDPSTADGMDAADIVSRLSTVQITPDMVLASSRDGWADWAAGTARELWIEWGPSGGNRVSIYWPQLQYQTPPEAEDRSGQMGERIQAQAVEADAEFFLCIH